MRDYMLLRFAFLGTILASLLGCAFSAGKSLSQASSPDSPECVGPTNPLSKAYTRHLGLLTRTSKGNFITSGQRGTDLGVSFPYRGQLLFLFGDTNLVSRPDTIDGLALSGSTYTSPNFIASDNMPILWWATADGKFDPITARQPNGNGSRS